MSFLSQSSLPVKYRPHNFGDVCGQDIIIKVLQRQLELKSFKNCYLFCGSSGCGKTTIARIFANEINGGFGHPIEIDAASNNGVDNVKNIVASASERALDSEYKIYIVDEAHMLTIQAWNAFLKCIEEPPAYTIFIFCTTDPQKIPSTILNRCMRFNIEKIDSTTIRNRLLHICEEEGAKNYYDTCDYISKNSNNQMRDAISNLEKVLDFGDELSMDATYRILGKCSYELMFAMLNNMIDGNEKEMLTTLNSVMATITDPRVLSEQMLGFIIDVNKYIVFGDVSMTQIPTAYEESCKAVTNFEDAKGYYNYVMRKLIELKGMMKNDISPIYTLQTVLLQIARCE